MGQEARCYWLIKTRSFLTQEEGISHKLHDAIHGYANEVHAETEKGGLSLTGA